MFPSSLSVQYVINGWRLNTFINKFHFVGFHRIPIAYLLCDFALVSIHVRNSSKIWTQEQAKTLTIRKQFVEIFLTDSLFCVLSFLVFHSIFLLFYSLNLITINNHTDIFYLIVRLLSETCNRSGIKVIRSWNKIGKIHPYKCVRTTIRRKTLSR